MGTKPGTIYRIPKKRLYTRREFMKGVPGPKIAIFDMGDLSNHNRFEIELALRAKETAQLTHNSLEAARIAANRYIEKKTGRNSFYMKILPYPHVVLRENKQASGAGADRVSDGMRASFGKPVSLGAFVKPEQKLIIIKTTPPRYKFARNALRRAASKFATPTRITVEKGKELIKE